jgi:hypothetical protein
MCLRYEPFAQQVRLLKENFMHIFFYFLTAVLWVSPSKSQDCVIMQGQAYRRATIPGNIPRKDLDESGKEIEAPVKKMNTFFIYVETKNNCTLKVIRLWIDGKAYHTIQEEILNTPVFLQPSHPGGKFDTLVRKTTNKVFRIHPREEWNLKPEKKIADRLERAKIVIEYANKSGTRYYQIEDIKRIAPMVLQ